MIFVEKLIRHKKGPLSRRVLTLFYGYINQPGLIRYWDDPIIDQGCLPPNLNQPISGKKGLTRIFTNNTDQDGQPQIAAVAYS
jgi:hypothetical protein